MGFIQVGYVSLSKCTNNKGKKCWAFWCIIFLEVFRIITRSGMQNTRRASPMWPAKDLKMEPMRLNIIFKYKYLFVVMSNKEVRFYNWIWIALLSSACARVLAQNGANIFGQNSPAELDRGLFTSLKCRKTFTVDWKENWEILVLRCFVGDLTHYMTLPTKTFKPKLPNFLVESASLSAFLESLQSSLLHSTAEFWLAELGQISGFRPFIVWSATWL